MRMSGSYDRRKNTSFDGILSGTGVPGHSSSLQVPNIGSAQLRIGLHCS
jgi:hypothetical protein